MDLLKFIFDHTSMTSLYLDLKRPWIMSKKQTLSVYDLYFKMKGKIEVPRDVRNSKSENMTMSDQLRVSLYMVMSKISCNIWDRETS